MHTSQLLFLLFVSSALRCSLQIELLNLEESPSSSHVDSDLVFDMQDVLQLFSAETSLLSKEDSSTVSANSKLNVLGAQLKEIENLLEVSLFTYITNQIANSSEEVFFNDSQQSGTPFFHPINTQNTPIEIPEPLFQENEETFQLKKYGNNELYSSIKRNITNEQNNLDQQPEISLVESIKINETPRDVVIVDEKLDRFLVPFILSVIDELDKNSSSSDLAASSNIESADALQGTVFCVLRGIYGDEDDEDFTLSLGGLRDDQNGSNGTYILGISLVLMILASVGFVARRLRARKELPKVTRNEEEEKSWYVEARDI